MRKYFWVCFLTIVLMLSACMPSGAEDGSPLTIAYPPILESLPLVVAQSKGLFEDRGLNVNLLAAKDSKEVARMVSYGRADCGLTSLPEALLSYAGGGGNLRITSSGVIDPDSGARWGLVTSAMSNISNLEKLVSNTEPEEEMSILVERAGEDHFLTDRLIRSKGFSISEDTFTYRGEERLSNILLRLRVFGGVTAAALPEPFLTLALSGEEKSGIPGEAVTLLDSFEGLKTPQKVLIFRKDYLNDLFSKTSGGPSRFYRAWIEAIRQLEDLTKPQVLNHTLDILAQTRSEMRSLVTQEGLTEKIAPLFSIPKFLFPAPPSEDDIEEVSAWLIEKDYIEEPVRHEDIYKTAYNEFYK